MWMDTNDSHGGGGFDVSGYDNSPSQSMRDSKQSKKPSSVFPVAIKQIIDTTEESLTIHGYPVSMITIVGIVRQIEYTSTKILYTVQDWSGTITGMLWLEADKDDRESRNVIENTYCRMSGTRRIQDKKVCLFLYEVAPVTNLCEITYHYLQVIHVGLKSEELKQAPVVSPSISATSFQNQTSSNFQDNDLGLTPNQKLVYAVFQNSRSESGIHKKFVIESLKNRVSAAEIEHALQFLAGEGHLYNTIDDDHFKATDEG